MCCIYVVVLGIVFMLGWLIFSSVFFLLACLLGVIIPLWFLSEILSWIKGRSND